MGEEEISSIGGFNWIFISSSLLPTTSDINGMCDTLFRRCYTQMNTYVIWWNYLQCQQITGTSKRRICGWWCDVDEKTAEEWIWHPVKEWNSNRLLVDAGQEFYSFWQLFFLPPTFKEILIQGVTDKKQKMEGRWWTLNLCTSLNISWSLILNRMLYYFPLRPPPPHSLSYHPLHTFYLKRRRGRKSVRST